MGPKKTNSTKKSCCGCWSSNDMRIGVSYFYSFLNCFMTICGSFFCLFITHQKKILLASAYLTLVGNTIANCWSLLLIFAIIFTLVLKCTRKSQCCGVALSNVQHFDINEWDVIEGEQEQHLEMREIILTSK